MIDNLTSLKALVTERIFKVPDYQRGYAWTDEQRQDLLEDIEEIQSLIVKSKYEHFTGTIVLEDKGDELDIPGGKLKKMDIVDGQQRLTTLVILLREFVNCYRQSAESARQQAAARLWDTFVKLTPDGPYLLELNNADVNRFFIDVILEETVGRAPQLSPEQNLLDAKRQFRQYLLNMQKKSGDKFFDDLDTVMGIVTSLLKFLVYQPRGQAEACFMFESMNARGLPLTQLEKTKNLLFFLAYKYKRDENQLRYLTEAINDTWRDVWRDLYAAQEGEEDQFLRFHWTVLEAEAWDPKR
jgi:uncharacterized protein with ParB-like and HNH nuclease domain